MTYRGDKLYDRKGDASHSMVKAKVAWFKACLGLGRVVAS
jgi:hypothetical protein